MQLLKDNETKIYSVPGTRKILRSVDAFMDVEIVLTNEYLYFLCKKEDNNLDKAIDIRKIDRVFFETLYSSLFIEIEGKIFPFEIKTEPGALNKLCIEFKKIKKTLRLPIQKDVFISDIGVLLNPKVEEIQENKHKTANENEKECVPKRAAVDVVYQAGVIKIPRMEEECDLDKTKEDTEEELTNINDSLIEEKETLKLDEGVEVDDLIKDGDELDVKKISTIEDKDHLFQEVENQPKKKKRGLFF